MNKREFVVVGGCGVLAAPGVFASPAVPGAASRPSGLRRPPGLVGAKGPSAWQAYLQHSFAVGSGIAPRQLELREVRRCCNDETADQFTLVFASAGNGLPLSSGTHSLRHATGQRVLVYLESAGAGPDGASLYRADFNQLA